MPDDTPSNDELVEILGSAFETIHDAVNVALAKATSSEQTNALLSEYNAARSAYTAATNKALNDADPSLGNLVDQLKTASKTLEDAKNAISQTVDILDSISKTVGVFTKIVALSGGLA
jgi:ABC-type transporter Mla subunit MlaD